MAKLIILMGLLLLSFSETLVKAHEDWLYKDPKQPLSVRLKDLVGRMTLEEKVGQMTQIERVNATAEVMKNSFIGKYISHFYHLFTSFFNIINVTWNGELNLRRLRKEQNTLNRWDMLVGLISDLSLFSLRTRKKKILSGLVYYE